jgi:N-acetylglutamate synthase-like GNAT family acetyltransferase
VPQPIAGRGIAAELMRSALGVARSQGWTVVPACSYAADYMAKHPDECVGLLQHQSDLLDEALEESFPASDPPAIGHST